MHHKKKTDTYQHRIVTNDGSRASKATVANYGSRVSEPSKTMVRAECQSLR